MEASMKAIAGISSKHMALLDEYRMALSLWSETRALYSPEAAKIMQATKHLEDLEHELSLCDVPLVAQQSSESGDRPLVPPPAVYHRSAFGIDDGFQDREYPRGKPVRVSRQGRISRTRLPH